jgi:hypothetical protein
LILKVFLFLHFLYPCSFISLCFDLKTKVVKNAFLIRHEKYKINSDRKIVRKFFLWFLGENFVLSWTFTLKKWDTIHAWLFPHQPNRPLVFLFQQPHLFKEKKIKDLEKSRVYSLPFLLQPCNLLYFDCPKSGLFCWHPYNYYLSMIIIKKKKDEEEACMSYSFSIVIVLVRRKKNWWCIWINYFFNEHFFPTQMATGTPDQVPTKIWTN